MNPADLLFTQGFGTRRVCAGLVDRGLFEILKKNGQLPSEYIDSEAIKNIANENWQTTDLDADLEVSEGMPYRVQGVAWRYFEHAYIVMNKPMGHECSQKPKAWPSVYSLLPAPLRLRPTKTAIQGVQAVGRLDQDTTGLLILSDDGAFVHRATSPKHHVPKVYEVSCKHPVTAQQVQKLLAGVVLDDSPKPVQAASCEQTGELSLKLTLTEGKYHQVKRMIAAVSNRVEGLHRSQMGGLALDDLALGQWRWLSPEEVKLIQ
jgi:16S rRNA pseudouridine516 synthase